MKTRISRYLFALCASLCLLFSCTIENGEEPEPDVRIIPYRVTVTGAQTKATLTNDWTQYRFQAGDRLYVNHIEEGVVKMYGFLALSSGANNTTAVFQGDLTCVEGFTPASNTSLNVTLFGASDVIHSESQDHTVETHYPDQFAETFSGAVEKFSHFTDNTHTFGAGAITLSQQSSFLIFNVTMKSDEEAPVGRTITAKFSNSGTTLRTSAITVRTAGSVPFVLAFNSGVVLNDAKLLLEWKDAEQQDQSKEFSVVSDQQMTLAANNYYTVSRTTIVDPPAPEVRDYFYVLNEEPELNIWVRLDGSSTLEYSTDEQSTWQTYSGAVLLAPNKKLYFRDTRTGWNEPSGSKSLFYCYKQGSTPDKKNAVFSVGGNLASFVEGENFETAGAGTKKKYTFVGFFKNHKSMKDAKDLVIPMTSFNGQTQSFKSFFEGCEGLQTAPAVLPATTLTSQCYRNMFYNCKALEKAPELPVAAINDSCYERMFWGCTNLKYIKMNASTSSPNANKPFAPFISSVGNDNSASWVAGVTAAQNTGVIWLNPAILGENDANLEDVKENVVPHGNKVNGEYEWIWTIKRIGVDTE